MRTDLFDFRLPEDLIASRPAPRRDGARLLDVGPAGLADRAVAELPELLEPGALVVVNDTKVIPARLLGHKAQSGGKVELLLVRRVEAREGEGGRKVERWRAMGKSSKPLRMPLEVRFDAGGELEACVLGRADDGLLEVELRARPGASVEELVGRLGRVPLPPYLGRDDEPEDRERYQTVYARVPGAVAAPTAGLHLSEALLGRLAVRGVGLTTVTLHVGPGTFVPVTADDLDAHPMHEEWYEVSRTAAAAIDEARGRGAPVVAVGTTVVRALESAADPARPGGVRPGRGSTRLLIQPGYEFRVVDALLTNFHLPRSTLLSLVAAFAGRSRVLAAYEHAVRERYRFYSYGDAMLLRERAPAAEAAS
ncbi:MAG TPA: tRNA preQ1(34) S-adenosylmethionine ribosyltransferase-isomerase QueA [Polyangiaceae bacterium]|nr:tRNA preQ1(34) S-adenosylmethionine ribosyltransferase-isomerase QueA [Polyangiaceae bacterium]